MGWRTSTAGLWLRQLDVHVCTRVHTHSQPSLRKERRGLSPVPRGFNTGAECGRGPRHALLLSWLELRGLSPRVPAVGFSCQFLSFLQGPPGGGGPPGTPIMPSPAGKRAWGGGAFVGAGTERHSCLTTLPQQHTRPCSSWHQALEGLRPLVPQSHPVASARPRTWLKDEWSREWGRGLAGLSSHWPERTLSWLHICLGSGHLGPGLCPWCLLAPGLPRGRSRLSSSSAKGDTQARRQVYAHLHTQHHTCVSSPAKNSTPPARKNPTCNPRPP